MPPVELSVCPVSPESALSLGIANKSDISNSNTPAVGFPSEKQPSLQEEPVFVWMTAFFPHKFSWTMRIRHFVRGT